ncbi:hypothetical protein UCDDA912_g04901 [Diaporthe ampelina]|uniref:Ricin B lectin domain-containing protein n=1 Tax=Diaporthe ampelina TaxID=1214573 RepID=A0A0G2HJ74_9PEZI|nr:hypothetical protein UCDDA912_g04901 [Diaporthe ampelina]
MLVVQSKTGVTGQQWHLQSGNSTIIYAPDTTLCLDAGAQSNWKDMSRVYLVTCTPGSASQQWDVMADGRIALVASKPLECLDLQYMRAVPDNPVGIYSCAGLGGIGAADDGLNWPLVNATG